MPCAFPCLIWDLLAEHSSKVTTSLQESDCSPSLNLRHLFISAHRYGPREHALRHSTAVLTRFRAIGVRRRCDAGQAAGGIS